MIGVIADDLSGAAEIGALGLRHGLSAEIVIRGGPSGRAELVCIDADSRGCSSDEAARRIAKATRLLRDAGADWIYKKVDSVLRGHVTAEVEAMITALEVNRALLVPANPSRGRIVRNGRYYVEGRPIHETEFARDPEHPRTSARIQELLEPSAQFPVQVARWRETLPASGIVVGEAARPADLEAWAGKRIRRGALAGAAEFFGALLKARGFAPGNPDPGNGDTVASGRELFVCGTSSRSSRMFLRSARTRRVPIFSLPSELVWGAEFTEVARQAVARRAIAAYGQGSRVILSVGLPTMRGPAAARMLTQHLVMLAEAVLREAEVHCIYAEGGATAAALVQRMGWTRLEVRRELAPGVAQLAVTDVPGMLLTVKPGSYVWPPSVRKGAALACDVSA